MTRDSWLVTHTSMLQTWLNLMLYLVVSFLYSFPYIMKSKFGNYSTLNMLAKQHRVQGGNFDPWVLTDLLTTSGKGQNRGEDRWMPILRLVFPHPSPCIWTTRVLQSLTLRLPPGCPRGWSSPPLNCWSMMYDLRWQPVRKKRRLLEPPLTRSRDIQD